MANYFDSLQNYFANQPSKNPFEERPMPEFKSLKPQVPQQTQNMQDIPPREGSKLRNLALILSAQNPVLNRNLRQSFDYQDMPEREARMLQQAQRDAEQNALMQQQQMDSKLAFEREKAAMPTNNIREVEALMQQGLSKNDAINAVFKSRIGASAGMGDPEVMKATTDLRKEFNNMQKDYFTVGDSFQKVQSTPETAAGDLSLIFSYMKMLDPGSVVRESEFKNAETARAWFDERGVPTAIQTAYNKASTGAKLTPEQRQDFRNVANSIYTTQKQRFDTQGKLFKDMAKSYGVPENYVVYDPYSEQPIIQPTQPAPTSPTNQSDQSAPKSGTLGRFKWSAK